MRGPLRRRRRCYDASSAVDVETSEAIDGLSNRFDRLGMELRAEMAAQGAELRSELRSEMALLRSELRGEIQRLAQRVEDNRRHADIQVERIRDDIRIVAEGVATLAVKLDRR
jgi:hypothetical protein